MFLPVWTRVLDAYEKSKFRILAFHDMDPQEPVHVLIVPKKHITSPDDLSDDDQYLQDIFCAR